MMNPPIFTVFPMNDHCYRLNEINDTYHLNVDAYLILGSERAILFDCLIDDVNLLKEIRKITEKPLTVILSHGHPDHAGREVFQFVQENIPVYMMYEDIDTAREYEPRFTKEMFLPLQDHQIFDLGDRQLEILRVSGHTIGSVVLLDRVHQELYSGDAIGSGHFWLQLSMSLPVETFVEEIDRLWHNLNEVDDFILYPGHFSQSKVELHKNYLADMRTLAHQIFDGVALTTDALSHPLTIGAKVAKFGLVEQFLYRPEKIYRES